MFEWEKEEESFFQGIFQKREQTWRAVPYHTEK